jgi:hypothetical protein
MVTITETSAQIAFYLKSPEVRIIHELQFQELRNVFASGSRKSLLSACPNTRDFHLPNNLTKFRLNSVRVTVETKLCQAIKKFTTFSGTPNVFADCCFLPQPYQSSFVNHPTILRYITQAKKPTMNHALPGFSFTI